MLPSRDRVSVAVVDGGWVVIGCISEILLSAFFGIIVIRKVLKALTTNLDRHRYKVKTAPHQPLLLLTRSNDS